MEILLDDSSSGGEDDTSSDVSSVLVKGDPEDLVDEDDDEVEDPSDDGGPEIVKVGIGPRYLTLTSKSVDLKPNDTDTTIRNHNIEDVSQTSYFYGRNSESSFYQPRSG